MKRFISLLLLCALCLCLLSCNTSPADSADTTVTAEKESVDVDLTVLSSTMVYAEVYCMLTEPDSYMGKTVKIRGTYSPSYYEETGNYYHYIVIADATACCSQGLEFLFSTEHTYPADFPAEGTEVEAVGVFGSYEELGVSYNYLLIDELTILG